MRAFENLHIFEESLGPKPLHAIGDFTFSVPPLTNNPQNPILDGLKFVGWRPKPIESERPVQANVPDASPVVELVENKVEMWQTAALLQSAAHDQILSWDVLRSLRPAHAASTPFLSEQSSSDFASAQHHVNLPPLDSSYVSLDNLFNSLRLTVTGTSSPLFTWDSTSQLFRLTRKGSISIIGKSHILSSSYVRRYLDIGASLRRLEVLISTIRQSSSSQEGPTLYAFAHSLNSTIAFLRAKLMQSSPFVYDDENYNDSLAACWLQFTPYDDVLKALTSMCDRGLRLSPPYDESFFATTQGLLSHIYEHLEGHIDENSPHLVKSVFAYIFVTTSRDYVDELCHSVGFGIADGRNANRRNQRTKASDGDIDRADAAGEESVFDSKSFPSFISPHLADSIIRGQRSLSLLRAAQLDHTLLARTSQHDQVVWCWNDTDAEAIRAGARILSPVPKPLERVGYPTQSKYLPDIESFKVFDQEPLLFPEGSSSITDLPLQDFVAAFPESLPLTAPTLSELNTLVFSGLAQHVATLSQALLSHFLSPSSRDNFETQIILLRSYMLLTSNRFKTRLAGALFSDSADRRERPIWASQPKSKGVYGDEGTWPVGLAAALTETGEWPPGGANLSFLLRTVIVDALEDDNQCLNHDDDLEARSIRSDRLGFAIRDLSMAPGKNRWLNPSSIESLDFLYLHYKAVHPMDVLIPTSVLSKYQRVFTFLLRLMRVEHAIKAAFRLRRASRMAFRRSTESEKLLINFRFIAQSFVMSVSSHVYDVAIGGPFDQFCARITRSDHGFSDAFELSQAHSSLLDDVLSACLLRSHQRAIGDLLRGSLEVVLEFAIMIGNMDEVEEFQMADRIKLLYASFRAKTASLVKHLRLLVDKEPLEVDATDTNSSSQQGDIRGLHQLLLRLDLRD